MSGEYIEHEQRGFEARRDQQVLEVLVAAVVEKLVDDLRRVETKREAFRSSASRLWSSRKSKGGRGPRHG